MSAPCDEKRRLLDAYRVATAAFSEQLTTLNSRMGVTSRDDYDSLRRTVDEARLASERARLALEQHVAEHHC